MACAGAMQACAGCGEEGRWRRGPAQLYRATWQAERAACWGRLISAAGMLAACMVTLDVVYTFISIKTLPLSHLSVLLYEDSWLIEG